MRWYSGDSVAAGDLVTLIACGVLSGRRLGRDEGRF